MDKHKLMRFFYELIQLGIKYPGRPGFGNPISWLLEQMCTRQEQFIARIVGDYTERSQEWRINGAGLKMYARVEKSEKDGWRRFRCSLGGDQMRDYPDFEIYAKQLIRQYGYDRRQ